jgi:hypothetical protein
MYPTDLPLQGQRNLARLYVGWLYYYHRHPVCNREYEYIHGHNTVKYHLDYEPSVYRDNLLVKFYTTTCLTCGVHQHGMRLQPFHSECYHCQEQVESETVGLVMHYLPTNPMAVHFDMLPVSVQKIVHEILLDSETHPRYNTDRIEEYRDE